MFSNNNDSVCRVFECFVRFRRAVDHPHRISKVVIQMQSALDHFKASGSDTIIPSPQTLVPFWSWFAPLNVIAEIRRKHAQSCDSTTKWTVRKALSGEGIVVTSG
jgi:hypothetical protein